MNNNKPTNNKKQKFKREALMYIDSLYNMSLNIAKNPQEAKDIVQETYYTAFKFLHHFNEKTDLKTWLFKMLNNVYITLYRKRIKEPKMIEYEKSEPFINLIQQYNDIDITHVEKNNPLNKLSSDDVASALHRLPYEYKIVVLLSDLEGFSYEDIADILECSIQTVRSRLSKGRRMLQEIFSTVH